MQITKEMLDALGITRDDILNLAAAKIADDLTGGIQQGNEHYEDTIETRVSKLVREHIEQVVTTITRAKCEEVISPIVDTKLAEFVVTETNRWGEKTGKSLTLTEFIVARIEGHMMEEVDGNGRSREECRARGDSFYTKGPRITAAITKFFQSNMDQAMKQVLAESAGTLGKAIEKAALEALGNIQTRLSANVTVK